MKIAVQGLMRHGKTLKFSIQRIETKKFSKNSKKSLDLLKKALSLHHHKRNNRENV